MYEVLTQVVSRASLHPCEEKHIFDLQYHMCFLCLQLCLSKEDYIPPHHSGKGVKLIKVQIDIYPNLP